MNKHKEIVFYGTHARELDMEDKIRLKDEFMMRYKLFRFMLTFTYSEWKKEFDALYPEKDKYSEEYSNFILEKCRYQLVNVNAEDIGLNEVGLYFESNSWGYIHGYTEKFGGLHIYLDT